MNLIAAVDKNWAIGYQNKLLTSIPEDMKFFRQTTTGKVVVMGRKTLESFPGKKHHSHSDSADHTTEDRGEHIVPLCQIP